MGKGPALSVGWESSAGWTRGGVNRGMIVKLNDHASRGPVGLIH